MTEPTYPGGRLRDQLRDSWRIWRHRWKLLGALGLTEERYHSWPLYQQRALVAAAIGAFLLAVLTPLSGFEVSALGAYLIFVAL